MLGFIAALLLTGLALAVLLSLILPDEPASDRESPLDLIHGQRGRLTAWLMLFGQPRRPRLTDQRARPAD